MSQPIAPRNINLPLPSTSSNSSNEINNKITREDSSLFQETQETSSKKQNTTSSSNTTNVDGQNQHTPEIPSSESNSSFFPLLRLPPVLQNHVGDFLRPKDINSFCNTNNALKMSLTASRNKKIIELSEKFKPYIKVPTEGMTPQQIIETIKNHAYISPYECLHGVVMTTVSWEDIFIEGDDSNATDILKILFETNMPFDKSMLVDAIVYCHDEGYLLKLVMENYDKEQEQMRQLISSGEYNDTFVDMLEANSEQGIYNKTKMLLKYGLNMEAVGKEALWSAADSGFPKIAKMMLFEYGADPEAIDSIGRTYLMLAVRGQNPNEETVKLLLKYDADIDAKDQDGHDVFYSLNIIERLGGETESEFEARRDRINNIIIPLLNEKKKETIATAQKILKEETNTTVYLEEILKNMDYPLARNIVIKYKKQLKTSFSASITSAPTTTPSLNPHSQFAHRA